MSREGEQKMSGNIFSELIGLMQNDILPDEIYTEVCKMVEKKIPYQSATLYVYDEENELLNQEFMVGPDVVDLITEFDFGGGTFDVALMKASEGIMKVVGEKASNDFAE